MERPLKYPLKTTADPAPTDRIEPWSSYCRDGYRFDLMGIIDQETMKLVDAQGKAIDSSFIVYGEGWNMMTALSEEKRTTIQNNRQTPHIGFFNDFFRDTLRGTNQMESKGYFSGDKYL